MVAKTSSQKNTPLIIAFVVAVVLPCVCCLCLFLIGGALFNFVPMDSFLGPIGPIY